MTLQEIRRQLNRTLFFLSLATSFCIMLEIGWLVLASHAQQWMWLHCRWLWQHSDDKTFLRMFADTWLIAIAMWLVNLMGIGSERRKGLLVGAANIIGLPVSIIFITG